MIARRRFLMGVGGTSLALPFLESVVFEETARAEVRPSVFTAIMRQGNGVQQGLGRGEPDRFWPRMRGSLSAETMRGADADRATSELADHASSLLLVSGTEYGFDSAGCSHASGLNQCLTAARPVSGGEVQDSLADGESVDWRIAQECNPPGVEPLNLMAGPQRDYIAHGLSYSGPRSKRGAENNPFNVYMDLVGLGGGDPMSDGLAAEVAMQRRSVNDLVREDMQRFLSSSYLGSSDRSRLQQHFDAIRDMEVTMSCELGTTDVDAMRALASSAESNDDRLEVATQHLNLMAMAVACGQNRVVTLQIGQGNDQTQYVVGGERRNHFHRISHRIDGDGSDGAPIANADLLHHEIDRMFARLFKHLLDRLSMYIGSSGGPLLDEGMAIWLNDIADGPDHRFDNLPMVIAGSAGGFLEQGQYVDAGGVTHNKFWNTIISAHGVTNASGEPYDSFGDASLERGLIDAMRAP
jgi:hypothetical protein